MQAWIALTVSLMAAPLLGGAFLYLPPWLGAIAALNQGIAMSTCPYLPPQAHSGIWSAIVIINVCMYSIDRTRRGAFSARLLGIHAASLEQEKKRLQQENLQVHLALQKSEHTGENLVQ